MGFGGCRARVCPCHPLLSEVDLSISARGGHTLQPLRYLALGEQGAGFGWGVQFQVIPSPQGIPGVARGGGLGHLAFSTLTPTPTCTEGAGMMPEVAAGSDPVSCEPLPAQPSPRWPGLTPSATGARVQSRGGRLGLCPVQVPAPLLRSTSDPAPRPEDRQPPPRGAPEASCVTSSPASLLQKRKKGRMQARRAVPGSLPGGAPAEHVHLG